MTRESIFVLGVDGGGSKTVAWLARCTPGIEVEVVGRGQAGPSNPMAVGETLALSNLAQAVAEACHEAGVDSSGLAAAVLGVAGSDRPETRDPILHLARRFASQVRVVHDGQLVLAAGSDQGWGVALISGTGSFAFARDRSGRSVRVGGWGWLMGDEGSGYAIGRAALQAVAQAADGRAADTQLLPRLLDRFQCHQPLELIHAVRPIATDRAAIAALAEYVFQAAEHGDLVAQRIVEHAANDLAAMVQAAAVRLGLADQPFPLALGGGVLLGGLAGPVLLRIAQLGLQAQPHHAVPEPVAGAVRLAARMVDSGE